MLFPDDIELQHTLVAFCNNFPPNVDVASLILQLLPYINEKYLKEDAVECLIVSLDISSLSKHLTVNALINLMSVSDIRYYIVIKLEEVFGIQEIGRVFLKDPLLMKLGYAYYRAKGKNEDEVNEKLISTNYESRFTPKIGFDLIAECVTAILVGFKNFADPAKGAQTVLDVIENWLKPNGFVKYEANYLMFQLIEEYPEFVKYYKDKLIEIIKKNVIVDDENKHKYRCLALKTLVLIAKNDITFLPKVNQFILGLPDAVLKKMLQQHNALLLKDCLPAEILMTNEITFNLVFDCLLPLLDINQKESPHINTYDKLAYYMKNLSVEQLEALAQKIQTHYKDPNKRSDFCQILLSNIERRLLINFAKSTAYQEYMSLIPIEVRESQVILHF